MDKVESVNNRNRTFENRKYLAFIRLLPCVVRWNRLCRIHAHHVDPVGYSQIRNDYTSVPLSYDIHVSDNGHISYDELEKLVNDDLQDVVSFYQCIYIEHLQGRYDVEFDSERGFYELKRKFYAQA